MGLAKLTITPLAPSKLKAIEVLFNPTSYSITKTVTWTPPRPLVERGHATHRLVNAPTLEFGGGGSRQLNLDLFFDVTEPIDGRPIDDVRRRTNRIVALARIERDRKRPPTCEVSWGDAPTGSDFPFIGVVTNLTQRFTLFASSGKPLRATLTVAFLEFLDPKNDQRKSDPEDTTRIVKLGDTLSSIAAEVYRDPTLWRVIAEANRVDDPRQLEPGRTLSIPKVH
jgi:nucleoid-associated protein YgaU